MATRDRLVKLAHSSTLLIVATLVFVFDLFMPLGVAGGVPYVAVVLLALRSPSQKYVLVVAGLVTALTALGYFFSAPGAEPWIVVLNRAMAIFVIWATAFLGLRRRQGEEMLRQSEARRATAQRLVHLGNWEFKIGTPDVWWSDEFRELHGLRDTEVKPSYEAYLAAIPPSDRKTVARVVQDAVTTGRAREAEYRVILEDREERILRLRCEVTAYESGRPLVLSGASLDVTEERRLERHLMESQKMEAVGQLTSGIAHEFNNLLTAILSYTSLLEKHMGRSSESSEYTEKIRQSVWHGATITQGLLAFARKQPLRPSRLSANEVILHGEHLLRTALGGKFALEINLAKNISHILADEHQLQASLLNLTLNARDAMKPGGCLRFRTASIELDEEETAAWPDATPGCYVEISVEDDGVGIPARHLEKVFEPFFTTKSVGKGTGLGLSMVYGFLKQSKGFVALESEEGRGSRVRLYFPALS